LSNELFGGTPPIGLAKGREKEKKKPSNNLVKLEKLVSFVSFSFVILCVEGWWKNSFFFFNQW